MKALAYPDRKPGRLWEVDFGRGVAVAGMIAFHLIFDIHFFFGGEPSAFSYAVAYVVACAFIFLVGVALHLRKADYENKGDPLAFSDYLRRGAKIFFIGVAATIATAIYPGDGVVVFGVLHCIGASTVIAYPFISHTRTSAVAAACIILAGLPLQDLRFPFPWLLWAGFVPQGFYTLDYFPLIPWFGVVLAGVAFGAWAYPRRQRAFSLPDPPSCRAYRAIQFMGMNSLLIYIIHQPILVGGVLILRWILTNLQ
jgi:uncharacterized membrane protein